uniref:ARAD1A02354p n=1 Tax=Blastobotrys adeninivorans TaxID=409370 RepID=A0A060SWM4_BLAAD
MPPKRSRSDDAPQTKRPRLVREPQAAERKSTVLVNGRAGPRASAKRSKLAINDIPTLSEQKLTVFNFGSGTICELGHGPDVTEIKRPRINPFLPADDSCGIVSVAAGGSHVVAIDYQGHLWSWGQNDSAVLGRNTVETEEEKAEDHDLNGRESTPKRVEGIPDNVVFVAVAATDNLSAAISEDGRVWAWGTFIDDGDKCFRAGGPDIQRQPLPVPGIRGAVAMAGGKDHLLILDNKGDVHAWGIGLSGQLGHQVSTRLRTKTFGPLKVVGLKNIRAVAAGEYHSFAIDHNDRLYAWGLNNFGQCCIPDMAGEGKTITKPTLVSFFEDKPVKMVAGGNHHSLVLLKSGEVYAVGETNFHQLGLPKSSFPKSTVYEGDGTTASYVPDPTKLTIGADGDDEDVTLPKFKYIAAGSDHSLALSEEDGSAWTWGFGEVYQLGHGKPAGEDSPEDEELPRRIRNTATTGVTMVYAGAGGQFSVLAGLPKEN